MVLDILCQCGNTIKECISFERNFVKKLHPCVTEKEKKEFDDMMVKQYLEALGLVYNIQCSCNEVQDDLLSWNEKTKNWFKELGQTLWSKLTNKVLDWKSDAEKLGRLKAEWAIERKKIEEKLTADEYAVKALTLFKTKNDPEPPLSSIGDRVMSNYYDNAAQWFFEEDKFIAWCSTFGTSSKPPILAQPQSVENQDHLQSPLRNEEQNFPEQQRDVKRVLWLRGGLGTGKTTVLYHTYITLKTHGRFNLQGRELRIIPYFCAASKTGSTRPNFETIIRAMVQHLALLPDFTLAEPAQERYNKMTSAQGQTEDSKPDWWTDLFKELIKSGADQYHFVFIVDALDECIEPTADEPSAAEKVLEFMSNIMKLYTNVCLLCSSHQQVPVRDYFGLDNKFYGENILQEVEVTVDATEDAMEAFIIGELVRRKRGAGNSIFCKQFEYSQP